MGIILLDIDGTLFDAERFGREIRAEFIKVLKIDEGELMRAIADYYAALEASTDFSPRDITLHIGQRYNINPIVLDQVFWENDKIYKSSLYPEVANVLKKLSETHILGIFSQGNEEFQARKLKAAGITDYFSKDYTFIHARKLLDETIARLPAGATVIDNKHDVAVKLSPFVDSIWLNRRTKDSDSEVRTIHSLEEVLAIMDRAS